MFWEPSWAGGTGTGPLAGGTAEIHGLKWHDLNGNGERDDGEPGLPNWTIFLDANGNGRPDDGERTTSTIADDPGTPGVNEAGRYAFTDLPVEDAEGPILYTVAEVLPLPEPDQPGWCQTAPGGFVYQFTLAAGESRQEVNFGNLWFGEIRGIKWEDLDGDGLHHPTEEPLLPNWTIFLDANDNGVLDGGETSTTTDEEGAYRFTNLLAGVYLVGEQLPVGWVRTSPPGPRGTRTVPVDPGGIATADFGNRKAEVFGTVFHDIDRDGHQDPDEPGLEGWTVKLDFDGDGSVDDTVLSTANGVYGFTLVPEGTHAVAVEAQEPYIQTAPADPPYHTVQLLPGQPLTEPFDFGAFHPPDLFPANLFPEFGSPGGQTPIHYDVAISLGPGALGPGDEWTEEIWLVDDQAVDNVGFELRLSAETYTEIGQRDTTVTLPRVGEEASTEDGGTVTVEMIRQGMNVVVIVDVFDEAIETDDGNNTAFAPFTWRLPDLVVFQGPPEQIGFEPNGQGGRREIILPESLTYATWLMMASIPEGATWTEQVWLGTDADVHLGTDLSQGRWHVRIAAGAEIPDTAGPFEVWESRDRVIQLQANRLELPKSIEPSDLKWIILVDWPLDASGQRPVPPEDANPGGVMEWHEMQPGAQTDNVSLTSAFDPIRRLDLHTDEGFWATPFSSSFAQVSLSDDGRFVAYTAEHADSSEHLYVHDRDRDADGIFDEPEQSRTWQIHRGFDGSPADGDDILGFMISGNGQYVVFASNSANLVPGDTNFRADVFRHDLATGQTVRVSVNSAGQQSSWGGEEPSISRDGSVVTFLSRSDNLVYGSNLWEYNYGDVQEDERHPFAADNNERRDAFVHYMSDGRTLRVPLGDWELHGKDYPLLVPPPPTPRQAQGDTLRGTVWFSGSFTGTTRAARRGDTIIYSFKLEALAPDLHNVAAVIPPIPGVRTTSVTVTQGTYDAFSGSWFVGDLDFWPPATVTIEGVVEAPVLTLRSTTATAGGMQGALTLRLAVCPEDQPAAYTASISADGTRVAVEFLNGSWSSLALYDLGAAQARPAGAAGTPDAHIWWPDISGDASTAVFTAGNPLDPQDTNDQHDVYVISAAGGDPVRVSVSSDGMGGEWPSWWPDINGDGRFVVFHYNDDFGENDLADGSWTRTTLRDLAARLTFPVMPRRHSGPAFCGMPGISDDGRWVAVVQGNRILPEDPSYEPDLYVEFIEHVQLGEVSGTVFQDQDRDGQRDPGEPGAEGVTVHLTVMPGGPSGLPDPQPLVAQTDRHGLYRFGNVVAGKNYKVTIDVPEGLLETFPGSEQSPGWYSVEIRADGGTGEVRNQEGIEALWPDFGVYPPPDLTADDPVSEDAKLGRQATVSYTTANPGPGVLVEGASWVEKLWLIDGEDLDGSSFKLPLGEARYEAVGRRTVTVTMPSLGQTASADDRVVTAALVKAGLRLAVQIDTEQGADPEITGEVEEIDEDNNEVVAADPVGWLLPDLVVADIVRPELAFGSELGELTYVVRNDGEADVSTALPGGEPASWTEQVWLGTNPDVLAEDDPQAGVWHCRVDGNTFSLPLAVGETAERTVTPDLRDVQLPGGIDPSQLNWYVLIDWPDGLSAAQADPAAVLERHELDPLDPQAPANAFGFVASEVNLAPLRLVADAGFTYDGSANHFRAEGLIRVGFAPPEGAEFQPLLVLNGELWYDRDLIHGQGAVTVEIGDVSGVLFNGEFTIAVGTSAAADLADDGTDGGGAGFTLAGVDVEITGLALVNPGGGDPSDARIELQGRLVLPQLLGLVDGNALEVDFRDPNGIVISADGVEIAGEAKLRLPDVEFRLLDLITVRSSDVVLTFSTPPAMVVIQGKFGLSQFALLPQADVELNFTDPDPDDDDPGNFIRIVADPVQGVQVDVIGEAVLTDVVLVPKVFELQEGRLFVDTVHDEIKVDVELLIPGEVVVIGGIGFYQGDFNYVRLGVDLSGTDLGLPVKVPFPPFPTIAKLVGIEGQVDNISPADPDPIEFGGGLIFVDPLPGELYIPGPSELGGPWEGPLARLDLTGKFDANHLEAGAELNVIGGMATVNGKLLLHWQKGIFKIDGNLEALNGVVQGYLHQKIDSQFNVRASAGVSLHIPDDLFSFPFGFLNDQTIAGAEARFVFLNDDDSSNDYLAAWGEFLGAKRGLKVSFDGEFDLLGAEEIEEIPPSAGLSPTLLASANGAARTFVVVAGRPWVVFGARWDHPADNVAIELVDPVGTTITEADMAAMGAYTVLGGGPGATDKVVQVLDPAPGEWTIRVVDTTGLGEVTFAAGGGTPAPTVALTGPTADVAVQAGDEVEIAFVAFDPDSVAQVSLFYDDDREGLDGLPIVEGILEDDGAGVFAWDTSGLPGGDYFIHAMIDDGVNPPVFSGYAPARVRIVDPLAPAAPQQLTSSFAGGGCVRLSWLAPDGADSYILHLTDDAAGESYGRMVATDGPVTEALISGLTPGETYRFAVQAVDGQHFGELSEPAVSVVGVAPTVPPEAGQWGVFADPGSTYAALVALDPGETPTLVSGPAGATLDGEGRFEWVVDESADGWSDVVIHLAGAGGTVRQVRRHLLSDSHRTAAVGGRKFLDLDADGTGGFGEPGLDGWQIQLVDAMNGDVLATRTTQGLDLDSDGAIDPVTERGLFSFDDLTPGDYVLRESLIDDWAATRPTELAITLPGGEEAQVSFGNRPLTASVGGTVFGDLDGNGARDDGEAGIAGVTVFADVNANGAPDTYSVTIDSADPSRAIPDLATMTSAIPVTGLAGAVASVSVTLNIDHTYDSDLDVFLLSPSGGRVLLFTDVGGGGEGFIGTTLDDGAAEGVGTAAAPFTGSYRPEGRLGDLAGGDPNGIWTLEVTDDAGSDSGALHGWSLTFTLTEPTAQTAQDDPATTDADEAGRYLIADLPAGTHVLRQLLPPGFIPIEPADGCHSVPLRGGRLTDGIDFADMPEAYIPPRVVAMVMNEAGELPSTMMSLAATFSEPVTVAPGALRVHSHTTGEDVDLGGVESSYDGDTHTARWWSPAGIASQPGYYTVTLLSPDIADEVNRTLDGDGDGHGGDDYRQVFMVAIPGDATLDGAVGLEDYIALKENFGALPGGPSWPAADFNGDAKVDRDDLLAMKAYFGQSIGPAPEPAAGVQTPAVAPLPADAVAPGARTPTMVDSRPADRQADVPAPAAGASGVAEGDAVEAARAGAARESASLGLPPPAAREALVLWPTPNRQVDGPALWGPSVEALAAATADAPVHPQRLIDALGRAEAGPQPPAAPSLAVGTPNRPALPQPFSFRDVGAMAAATQAGALPAVRRGSALGPVRLDQLVGASGAPPVTCALSLLSNELPDALRPLRLRTIG